MDDSFETIDANAKRRELLTRRVCEIMGWEYKTARVFAGIRKVAKAEAVAVGLDKLQAIIQRLEGSMSIDARVEIVIANEDDSGSLKLIDRPAKPGGTPGIAGQTSLLFDKAPEEVTALNGRDIWGGDSAIMLGEVEIARRVGYTKIVFHDAETFKRAVAAYRG